MGARPSAKVSDCLPSRSAVANNRPGALPRTARVGVLGGGQLGRMLAIAAVRVP